MSTLRQRLAALRARREAPLPATSRGTSASKDAGEAGTTPAKPRGTGMHMQAIRGEWRARARNAASERVRKAALDSGVYDVITRPLPTEKDDIEELEKRRREELADEAEHEDSDGDEDEDEAEAEGHGEEVDEEEAALLRLNNGDETRDGVDTRDGNDIRDGGETRDGVEDTRGAERNDEEGGEQVAAEAGADDVSTVPDGEQPESAQTDDKEGGETQPAEEIHEDKADDTPPREPKPAPISETGPEMGPEETPEETPPETPEATPVKAAPAEVTPPRNPLGMVEDEAEHDGDDEIDNQSPDLSGDDVADIVPDAEVGEKEAARLAEFHRNWEVEQMEPSAPRYDDLDDAMDFTDVKASSDDAVEGISAEGGVVTDCDRADNYINAMFLREDSKSKVVNIEEDDDIGDETTRGKARALWKARQKFRTELRERDESNSLSRFDLFSDTKNRSADIRSRLEKSCRPAPLRDVTNVDKGKKRKRELPEWARRKEILAQKERKRRRAVSVGNWSFAMHGKREETDVKKTSVRPSLGAAHLTKRSRTRKAATPPRARPPVARVSRRTKGATSFKGLLSVLGNQASVDQSR